MANADRAPIPVSSEPQYSPPKYLDESQHPSSVTGQPFVQPPSQPYSSPQEHKHELSAYAQDAGIHGSEAQKPKRICGLSPKVFWILVVIAVVLVAAIIGAAVGGYMAGKNKG